MTDVKIPENDRPSRLDRRPKQADVEENPDDINTLNDRIRDFRFDYPKGITRPEPVLELTGPVEGGYMWTFRASVWRDYKPSTFADSIAHASVIARPGGQEYTDLYPAQCAESFSLIRALRFLAVGITPDVTGDTP